MTERHPFPPSKAAAAPPLTQVLREAINLLSINYTAMNLRQGWSRKGSGANPKNTNLLIGKALSTFTSAPGFVPSCVLKRKLTLAG